MRQVPDEHDLVAHGCQPSPPRLDHGPYAGTLDGCRDELLNDSASDAAMLPKPKKTGGSPARRKSSRRSGGFQPAGPAGHQYPVTCTSGGQSSGRGTTAGLNPWQIGQPGGGLAPAGSVAAAAGRAAVRERRKDLGVESRRSAE